MKKQWYTIKTIAKINSKSYFRNRTALFFTIAFPLIFLMIFGSLFGKSSNVTFKVALINQSNSKFAATLDGQLQNNKLFKVDKASTSLQSATTKMNNGQLDAAIILPNDFGNLNSRGLPAGTADIYYNPQDQQTAQALSSVVGGIFEGVNTKLLAYSPPLNVAEKSTNTKATTPFDYVFAGMVGFSIIGIGIFGPTNAFPEQKKQGILRRMRTTPVTSAQYIIGNVLSYTGVGVVAIAILFIVSKLVFHLDMQGSYISFLVVAVLGIVTIFGFGMAVGGWAKNEQQAAPLSNLVAFPMMFLSGTFFPTYLMPEWLQKVSSYLPLTPIIDGLRYIVTGDRGLLQLGPQLLLIGGWIIVIYLIAFRVFRWE
jgi:ABC-2 type transport system permease protein